jgi:hypothetical protein
MSNLPDEVQRYTADYEAKMRSAKENRKIERPEVVFKKGARFFKDETTGKTMFGFRTDVNNDFVAVAKDNHRDDHPNEWLAFARSQKGAKK